MGAIGVSTIKILPDRTAPAVIGNGPRAGSPIGAIGTIGAASYSPLHRAVRGQQVQCRIIGSRRNLGYSRLSYCTDNSRIRRRHVDHRIITNRRTIDHSSCISSFYPGYARRIVKQGNLVSDRQDRIAIRHGLDLGPCEIRHVAAIQSQYPGIFRHGTGQIEVNLIQICKISGCESRSIDIQRIAATAGTTSSIDGAADRSALEVDGVLRRAFPRTTAIDIPLHAGSIQVHRIAVGRLLRVAAIDITTDRSTLQIDGILRCRCIRTITADCRTANDAATNRAAHQRRLALARRSMGAIGVSTIKILPDRTAPAVIGNGPRAGSPIGAIGTIGAASYSPLHRAVRGQQVQCRIIGSRRNLGYSRLSYCTDNSRIRRRHVDHRIITNRRTIDHSSCISSFYPGYARRIVKQGNLVSDRQDRIAIRHGLDLGPCEIRHVAAIQSQYPGIFRHGTGQIEVNLIQICKISGCESRSIDIQRIAATAGTTSSIDGAADRSALEVDGVLRRAFPRTTAIDIPLHAGSIQVHRIAVGRLLRVAAIDITTDRSTLQIDGILRCRCIRTITADCRTANDAATNRAAHQCHLTLARSSMGAIAVGTIQILSDRIAAAVIGNGPRTGSPIGMVITIDASIHGPRHGAVRCQQVQCRIAGSWCHLGCRRPGNRTDNGRIRRRHAE